MNRDKIRDIQRIIDHFYMELDTFCYSNDVQNNVNKNMIERLIGKGWDMRNKVLDILEVYGKERDAED